MGHSFQDRTNEFVLLTEEIRKRKNPKVIHLNSPFVNPKLGKNRQRLRFTLAASELAKQLHKTTEKLAQLTELAKTKSLFDDKSADINMHTTVIKQDINTINQRIDALENEAKYERNLRKNEQTEDHANTVVTALKSKLASATKKFHEVLETRTKNIKIQTEKRQKLDFVQESLPKRSRTPSAPFTHEERSDERFGGNDRQITIALPSLQEQTLLDSDDSYLVTQTEAVENIESTMVELQGIFQRLALIVAEHGEMMQRIDENIEEAAGHVSGAQEELLKYLKSISSNRGLIVKVFLVLIVFIAVFVVFFA